MRAWSGATKCCTMETQLGWKTQWRRDYFHTTQRVGSGQPITPQLMGILWWPLMNFWASDFNILPSRSGERRFITIFSHVDKHYSR